MDGLTPDQLGWPVTIATAIVFWLIGMAIDRRKRTRPNKMRKS